MPVKLDDEKRAAILAAIESRKGQCSRAALAREFEVSASTVGNIAREAGITDAFARTKTAAATRARSTDLAARRAALAERMLDLAESISNRVDSSYTVVVATQHEVHIETLPVPPLKETKDGMAAAGMALKAHMDLVRFDTKDGGNAAAVALVDVLARGFGLKPDQAGEDDGYPVPLPNAAANAAGAAELSADAAAAAVVTT
jgi:transposase-like protein